MVPLVNASIKDSELIIHFQEAYARLFSNCFNKQGIQLNVSSKRPMDMGTICAKVYSEGVQPIKRNNCGLIPIICKQLRSFYICELCFIFVV